MTAGASALRRGDALRLAGAGAALLAVSAMLGVAVNFLRPAATRLPWTSDWAHHVENLAFRAGIPVTFLEGARTRAGAADGIVFDARIPEQYAAGHLPGAINLPLEDVERQLGAHAARLHLDTPILVYCGGADCTDALELAVKLRGLGFTDLTLYPGGYAEWVQYGGATRAGDAP